MMFMIKAMTPPGGSRSRMWQPNGAAASNESFRHWKPNGIPMMVRHSSNPPTT